MKTYYVRDPAGQVLSEFRRAASAAETPEWAKDTFYLAGRLLSMKENLRPEPPRGLRATQTSSQNKWDVSVFWEENTESDRNGYKVYRKREGVDTDWTSVGNSPTASFIDAGGYTRDSVILYRVSCLDTAAFESEKSAILKVVAGDRDPPDRPSITAQVGDRRVTLSFSSSDPSGVAGYYIYRGLSQDSQPLLTSQPLTGTTYTDLNLQNGTIYYYRVQAVDTLGNLSALSCYAAGRCALDALPKDSAPPAPPRSIKATTVCGAPGTPEKIRVSWEPNPATDNVGCYELYRSATPQFGATPLSLIPGASFDDDPNLPAGTYYYAAKALDSASCQIDQSNPPNKSAMSEVRAVLKRDHTRTLAIGLAARASDGSVTLSWNAASPTPDGGTYYVYRKVNAEEGCGSYVQVGPTAALSFTDGSMANNAAYEYAVTGRFAGVESSFSRPALAVPLARPGNLYQCSGYAYNPSTSHWDEATELQWSPPTATAYQPSQASPAVSLGYLKGYHLYHHKLCKRLIFDIAGNLIGLWDKNPLRQFTGDASDPSDPYLLKGDPNAAGYQLPDPRYWINENSQNALSPPFEFESGDNQSIFYECVSGNPEVNCVMPKAVYKIYAEGTWLTAESGWPDYFDNLELDPALRCMQPLKAPYDTGAGANARPAAPQCKDVRLGPPTNVRALPDGPGSIKLTWTAPSTASSIAGYHIYGWEKAPSRAAFVPPLPFATAGPGATEFRVTGLPSNLYQFRVASFDAAGRTSFAAGKRCMKSTASCVDFADCPSYKECSNTRAACQSNADCSSLKRCAKSSFVSCSTDAQCPARFCSNGPQSCTVDSDCTFFGGGRCIMGYCALSPHGYCASDAECTGPGNYCGTGACSNDASKYCRTGSDCSTGGSCIRWNICNVADVCTQRSDFCEDSMARHCVQTGGACTVDADCPNATRHCSQSTAIVCTLDQHCPSGEICPLGETCVNDGYVASPLSTLAVPLLKTVLWTINDPTYVRGRGGIKLAWSGGGGAGFLGFRVYRSTVPMDPGAHPCVMLQKGTTGNPNPAQLTICNNEASGTPGDPNAASAWVTVAAGGAAFYWDRTVLPDRTYYYRVTRVSSTEGNETETPLDSSDEVEVTSPAYEPVRLPPPAGLKAWAPWNAVEKGGVYLRWCPSHGKHCSVATTSSCAVDTDCPSAQTCLDDAPQRDIAPVTQYRIYRSTPSSGLYTELARVSPACLDAGKRCEITQVGSTNPVTPTVCTDGTGASCRIVDKTVSQPTINTLDPQFTFYSYSYVVTAVSELGNPAKPASESLPSLENTGWPNYLQGGIYSIRRDPDGNGETLVCGDEYALLRGSAQGDGVSFEPPGETDGRDFTSAHPEMAPYRTIGFVIDPNDGGGGGGGGSTQNPYNPPARFVYYHLDHLGSPRVILNKDGLRVALHHFLPFGEERPILGDTSTNTRAFTDHERDAENGLDYMMTRYYSSSIGRFITVDLGDDSQLPTPQSWNRYAYVGNEPLIHVDMSGESRASFFVKTVKNIWKEVTRAQALNSYRAGKNVRVVGRGASGEAAAIANAAKGKNTPIGSRIVRHEPHKPGQLPHYQTQPGDGSHVGYTLYGAIAPILLQGAPFTGYSYHNMMLKAGSFQEEIDDDLETANDLRYLASSSWDALLGHLWRLDPRMRSGQIGGVRTAPKGDFRGDMFPTPRIKRGCENEPCGE